jgi:hypothetical protein
LAWNVDGAPVVPYRLPELIEAIAREQLVCIVEGEGKVELLRSWNVPATCCASGAKKWKSEHAAYLRDADVVIIPDNDDPGREHIEIVAASLQDIAASVRVLDLPGLPPKGDIVDWAAAGGTVEKLHELIPHARTVWRKVAARSLDDVHKTFCSWLGDEYDTAPLDAMLAVAASERLPGDPAWLLIISGSGNAKTETAQATSMLGAHIVSTLTSDAALLSATPHKQKAKTATGGLLRKIGERGILVIKDVTSILSIDRNMRATILAALREIHDGQWVRNVGSDGGRLSLGKAASSSSVVAPPLGTTRTASSRAWATASCWSARTPTRAASPGGCVRCATPATKPRCARSLRTPWQAWFRR